MRSASPSTSVRSSFPLKKALFVKSPGSACLQPGTLLRALRTARTTAGPPCVWNSTESSPVKLRGPVSYWKSEVRCWKQERELLETWRGGRGEYLLWTREQSCNFPLHCLYNYATDHTKSITNYWVIMGPFFTVYWPHGCKLAIHSCFARLYYNCAVFSIKELYAFQLVVYS